MHICILKIVSNNFFKCLKFLLLCNFQIIDKQINLNFLRNVYWMQWWSQILQLSSILCRESVETNVRQPTSVSHPSLVPRIFKSHNLRIYKVYDLSEFLFSRNNGHKNFHAFYDFLDAANADHMLNQYHLEENRQYRYLGNDYLNERERAKTNVKNFNKLLACMKDTLEFTENQLNAIWRILAAILNIGELSVSDEDEGEAKIDDFELINNSKQQPITS